MEGGKEANYWPGFVDALSNVVLTLVFVLVIFVFALLMASNKVAKKMQEVVESEKQQAAGEQQLQKALSELQQLRAAEPAEKSQTGASSNQACVKFSKSDELQKTELDPAGTYIFVYFNANAITVTDETTKAVHDYIDAYRDHNAGQTPKFAIVSPENPDSQSPLMTRETQLGRMLNLRNSLLTDKIESRNIIIHNIPPLQQNGGYDWVKIYVEK